MVKASNNHQSSGFSDRKDELKLLKIAVEHAPVAISMTRKDGKHIYHNLRFQDMFGYKIEEINTRLFKHFFSEPTIVRIIAAALEKKGSWSGEVEMKDRSGRIVPVILQAEMTAGQDDQKQTIICTFTDIADRRAKRKVIQYQSEYLSTLHSISLGMFRRLELSDLLNSVIVRASRITGIPNGFLHLYDPKENLLEMKAACGNLTDSIGYKVKPGTGLGGIIFQTGEPMIIDNYQQWANGIKDPMFDRIFSIVGIPLVSGLKIEGVIGLSHHEPDMTIDSEIISILEEFSAIAQIAIDNAKLFANQKQELEKRIELEKERKEIELKLQQSQKLESIGTLAGGIAHDFNNILSSIMGYVQIAMAESPGEGQLSEDLNEIYKASIRARDLTGQILTFARQSDGSVTPLKISLIAKEVLKFIRSSIPSTIQIRQNIASHSKVAADPTQLYQVFLNLLTNASQAMEENGGQISVDIVDETLIHKHSSMPPGDYVKIIVSDTGIGIPRDRLSKIFDPYYTTKAVGEGTGLGLSVVHGAIAGMGGEIVVDSEPGQGTAFTIHLPVVVEKSDHAESAMAGEALPQGNGEHIMVVDDEEAITRIQKRLLERLQYKATVFNDSLEALAAFKANPEKFAAVLTDMTMPHLTGDRLMKEIKEICPDMPVILCTGFSQYLTKEAMEEKGVRYYCHKPILNAQLAMVVRAAIDGTQMDVIHIDENV